MFYITVYSEDPNTIESTVRNFKEWMRVTTNMYVSHVIDIKRQERIRKEQEMRQLIKQKEAEKNIASKLKALL